MNILALIPARGGSKGVPKKNIKKLSGFPLISYTIAAAKLSKKINRVLVTTDSQEIADISKKYNAEVPFLRPAELSCDKSTDIDFVLHALNWLKDNESYIPDFIVLLRPTTPLREVELIDNAIEELEKKSAATSLRSAHVSSESPFKWFSVKDNFYDSISNKYNLEDTNRPRQYFPDVYIPNGHVDILIPSCIEKDKSLFGNKILSFITPVCYEIDTIEEFEYIEYIIEKKSSNLKKYLEMRNK